MKKWLSVPISVALMSFAFQAYGAELKIGVVNVDQVLAKSPVAVSLNEKLSKDFKPRQEEVNKAQRRLQDDLDQLNYNSYNMSQDDRNKLQNTINADRRTFDQLNAALQRDLEIARGQYTQQFMTKLVDAVTKIAQKEKYDMIQTRTNMFYINDQMDITAKVLDQLGS